jgi:hypothetical protein
MADLRRAESPTAAPTDAAARDSRAEALLVEGLDEYFAGRYHDAIHIWTRVLFLDRAHPRARAYIDRARTALAERQRQADELLAETAQLLDRGHTETARERFDEAAIVALDDESLASVRTRLERQEHFERLDRTSFLASSAADPARTVPVPGWRWPVASRATSLTVVALLAALAALVIAAPAIEGWLDWRGRADRELGSGAQQPLPVLSSVEVALIRARTLYNAGRWSDALRELDRVAPDSPRRNEVDAFRSQIQAALLAGAPERFRPRVDR